jgi:hypothetical protein
MVLESGMNPCIFEGIALFLSAGAVAIEAVKRLEYADNVGKAAFN